MIDPIEPMLQGILLLGIRDEVGGALTVHREGPRCGLVVSDKDGPGATAAINLTREDRAHLIRVLTEINEDESLR